MNRRLDPSGTPPGTARAATRVLDILELLAHKPVGLTLSEVAAELSVPISSLHSLMRVLEARRYLVRGRDRRRFTLGPRLPEVSRAYLDPDEPFATAQRAMHDVAAQCGETVHLAILAGRDVLYTDGIASRYPFSAGTHAGQRFPAPATAAGKALLADLPADQLAVLFADSGWPHALIGVVSPFDALQQELDEIRWIGFARDGDGIEAGVHGLAAVLPEQAGRPPTAVSISVPAVRLRGDGFWNLVGALRRVVAPPVIRRTSSTRSPLIGWSLSMTGNNSVYAEMRRGATEAMERHGGRILWATAPNEFQQADDVRRLLEEPLDALVIHPTNAVAAAPIFEEARRREMLLVCYHRPARTRAFDFFVGGDTYVRGCLQAHAAARLLEGRGGVFVVEGGVYDDNARSISQGTRETLASYVGIQLLGSQPSEKWLSATAQSLVREALDMYGPERVNAIIAANDEMAFGIAEVLADQGLTSRVALIGGDGAYHSIAMIRSGTLAGTVLQDSARMGATTLEYIMQVLCGSAAVADLPRRSLFHVPDGPPVSALDVPYTWVDATNLSVLEDYWKRYMESANSPGG